MNKKKVITAILTIFLLSGILALFLGLNLSYNHLKPKIIQIVKEQTGRDLFIEGDIALAISLSPEIVISNVGLQNAPWGSRPNLLTVEKIGVKVNLLPLIRGILQITRVFIEQPDIIVEFNKSGASNFDFTREKLSEKPKSAVENSKDAKKSSEDSNFALFLHHLEVIKPVVTYKDHQQPNSFTLPIDKIEITSDEKLDFSSGRLAGKIDIQALGARGSVNGKIGNFNTFSRVDLSFEVVHFQVEKWAKIFGSASLDLGNIDLSGKFVDKKAGIYLLSDLEINFPENHLGGGIIFRKHKTQPMSLKASLFSKQIDLKPFLSFSIADKNSG